MTPNDDENLIIKDGVLVGVKDKGIKRIIIPDGIKKIGENALSECTSLQKITIPNSVTEISWGALSGCSSLEEIIIPSSVEVIGGAAFSDCISLKEIIIPNSVKEIGEWGLSGCTSLKKITIPDSVKEISRGLFVNCSSLQEVVLPSSVEVIRHEAFRNCTTLSNIIIPDSVKTIEGNAFTGCKNLKEIQIPEDIKKVGFAGDYAFGTTSIKTIIISVNKDKISSLTQFTAIQKIKYILNHETYFPTKDVEFKVVPKKEDTTSKKTSYHINDDIEEIIAKIEDLYEETTYSVKSQIKNRINNLLNEYEEVVKQKYENDREASYNDYGKIKNKLLQELESIYIVLSREVNEVDVIKILEGYCNLTKEEIKELNNERTLEGQIKNIIFITSFLDDKMKNEILVRLDKILNETKDEVTKYLATVTDNDEDTYKRLSVLIDYEIALNENISLLYGEIVMASGKIKPYIELLDSLMGVAIINKESEITKDISTIRLVFSKLSSGKYKDELIDKFNKISEKYQEQLINIVSNNEVLENTSYEDIEMNLRQDLQSLLALMNNYAYLDTYIKTGANRANLINQIEKSINIISNGNYYEYEEDSYQHEIITSTIINICAMFQENDDIQSNDSVNIKNELITVLNHWQEALKNNTIDTLDEYNEVVNSITKELIGIQLKIEKHLKDIDHYNKYTK